MTVTVNGVAIAAEAIAAEAQNHFASDPAKAYRKAVHALIIRELLLQRARALGIEAQPEQNASGRCETGEEALIRQVIETEVEIPSTDEEFCHRYFESNRHRFKSPTFYNASHILFAAQPDDSAAGEAASRRAAQTIERLVRKPDAFASLARDLSDCPSGRVGGRLGQITRGDTVPEIDTFLEVLEEGQLCPVPVKSRFGIHVLRLERRIPGRELPGAFLWWRDLRTVSH